MDTYSSAIEVSIVGHSPLTRSTQLIEMLSILPNSTTHPHPHSVWISQIISNIYHHSQNNVTVAAYLWQVHHTFAVQSQFVWLKITMLLLLLSLQMYPHYISHFCCLTHDLTYYELGIDFWFHTGLWIKVLCL